MRSNCAICDSRTESLIELPQFPLTGIFVKERPVTKEGFIDQSFQYCPDCGHGQLGEIIDPQYIYSKNYFYRTSQSLLGKEAADYFIRFVMDVTQGRTFKHIAEIGCNDLYILKSLKTIGDKFLGVDPIQRGRFEIQGITVIGDMFTEKTDIGSPDLIICKDTLEHIPEPMKVLKNMVDSGSDDALFIFQIPILETLLTGCRFDQIFHQHVNYFSLKSLGYALDEIGCELIGHRENREQWGALLFAFRKTKGKKYQSLHTIDSKEIMKRYSIFETNMDVVRRKLELLKDCKVCGYGAGLMLPVLNYHLKNELNSLECIVDDDENKCGLYYINLPVRIEHNVDLKNAHVVVTAISSTFNVRKILLKLFDINPEQIIVPIEL